MDALRSIAANEVAWLTVGIISGVLFVGTLLAIPWIVARLDHDYFVGPSVPRNMHHSRVRRAATLIVRNLLGGILVLAGIAMLVLPGQGLLTVLIGLAIARFPGKRRLEQRLAGQRHVRRSLNWIRKRAGKPALTFDGDAPEDTSPSSSSTS